MHAEPSKASRPRGPEALAMASLVSGSGAAYGRPNYSMASQVLRSGAAAALRRSNEEMKALEF